MILFNCNFITSFLCCVTILVGVIRIFVKITAGRCKSNTCLIGKTCIITGGNAGLGYQTALSLAGRGCRIIIADKDNSAKSKERIIEETGNKNIVTKHLDLASFESIRKLAKDIHETEERLDILINNAGGGLFTSHKTIDGCNIGMQINHFGSFLLTYLLVDLLKKSAPSRIIFTSSWLAFVNNLTVENLNNPVTSYIYSNSKLCNVITARGFAEKLKGTGVTSNSLHPGLVNTEIFKKLNSKNTNNSIIALISNCLYFAILPIIGKTAEEGCQTILHLALSRELQNASGLYFSDCRPFILPKKANDEKFCKKIWKLSEEYVKLTPEEILA